MKKRAIKRWVIRAFANEDSSTWMFVSREPGSPFTTVEAKARRYATCENAVRSMERLRETARHWQHVGNRCEVSSLESI